MVRIAAEHKLPVENLLAPDTLRRLAWEPPDPIDPGTVTAALRRLGAREWQVGLTLEVLLAGLVEPVTLR